MITPELLGSLRVLWRQPDTMTLWGIPYDLREGQAPRDIFRARQARNETRARGRPGTFGLPEYQDPTDGWYWLGQPGWWGDMPRDQQALVADFLAAHAADVPQGPSEWATLD